LEKITSIPVNFEKIEEIADSRFTRVKVWIAHTGINLNNSYFSKETLEKMIPSLANVPIVGYITADNLDEKDFNGHEQKLVIDDNGIELVYIGRAYGIVPENNNAKFETKEVNGEEKLFLTCEGLLWNKFKDAIEIFDRDGKKPHSMELEPDSIKGEFADDGSFHFVDAKFEALCILGTNVSPAMTGSLIEKFSVNKLQEQLKEILDEFNTCFNSKKGGKKVNEKLKIIELFTTLQEEDLKEIKDNLDNYSVNELVSKLREMEVNQYKQKIIYELSHDDIRNEIYEILNPIGEDGHREWNYWILEVFDDYCIVEDEKDLGTYYKIPYSVDEEENITLGEKQQIVSIWVTPEEAEEIENMRNNFEKIKQENEQLKEFKSNIEKEQREQAEQELFERFSSLLEENVLNEVKAKASQFTIEELEKELKLLWAENNIKFESKKKEKPKATFSFERIEKSSKPYADRIKKYQSN
jgi:hypothetical protein